MTCGSRCRPGSRAYGEACLLVLSASGHLDIATFKMFGVVLLMLAKVQAHGDVVVLSGERRSPTRLAAWADRSAPDAEPVQNRFDNRDTPGPDHSGSMRLAEVMGPEIFGGLDAVPVVKAVEHRRQRHEGDEAKAYQCPAEILSPEPSARIVGGDRPEDDDHESADAESDIGPPGIGL